MYRFLRDSMAVTLIAVFCGSLALAAPDGHEWEGVLSASIGHDDNLTLEDNSSAVASELDDEYLELLGTASRYITGVRHDGIRINGTLFSRQYDSESDYDFTLVGLGIGYDKKFSDWKTRFEAGYDYIEFGSDTYQKIVKLGVEGRHPLSKDVELRLRYEANLIDSPNDLYKQTEGTRQFVRAETRIKQDRNRYRLSYTYETNDRDDFRTATTFESSSPNRHILRANARIPFGSKWEAEIDARYRMSHYRDRDLFSDGSSKTRDDDRFRSRLGIEYKLASKTALFGRYDYYDNDSNIQRHEYTRELFSVGIQHFF